MNIEDIKENSRVQIDIERKLGEGYASSDVIIENYRGVVMNVEEHLIILVTDYGKEVHISKDDVISVARYTFDKNLSQAIMKLKSFYKEKYELMSRIQILENKELNLVDNLLNANMLSKYNILGAKNRMQKSISKELTDFTRGIYLYTVTFQTGRKDELELHFNVSNVLEHYQNEIIVEKLIRAHAPDEADLLRKVFGEIGTFEEIGSSVAHVEGNIYEVVSKYKLRIKISKDNYTEMRAQIIKSLISLRK